MAKAAPSPRRTSGTEAKSRTALLHAAEKLFAEKGFAATSIRDIAKGSGLNLSLISYYFGSKEQLFAAMMEERVHFLEQEKEEQLARAKDSWQRLRVLVGNIVQRLFHNRDMHRIIVREMTIPDSAIAHEIVRKKTLRNSGQLMAFVQEGIDRGDFRKMDPAMVGLTIYGSVSHYILFRENLATLRKEKAKAASRLGDRDRAELENYLYDLLVRLLQPTPKKR
jgi:AcrR family transcriptional regulator